MEENRKTKENQTERRKIRKNNDNINKRKQ